MYVLNFVHIQERNIIDTRSIFYTRPALSATNVLTIMSIIILKYIFSEIKIVSNKENLTLLLIQ